MKFTTLILVLVSIYCLMKITEKFVNFNDLNGFDNNMIINDEPKIKDFKPKKTSNLIGYCDEKRGTCYYY